MEERHIGEVLLTRRVGEVSPPSKMMGKMVICCEVLGKPIKIHIEFKDPVAIDELPRTVVEDQAQVLENLEAQIWVAKEHIDTIEKVARVEEDEDEEREEDD